MKRLIYSLLLLSLLVAAAAPAYADSTYIVQRGDTLSRIARRFNVGVGALVAANHIANPNLIYVGQRLVIPTAGTGTPPPTGQPWTGQYVVQRGDTLWRIAQRFGSTVQAIMAANNLRSTLIYAGQVLVIPGAPASQVPPTQPAPTPGPTTVPQPCDVEWFFSPRPYLCPAAPVLNTWAAAERFEHGLMLWLEATDTFYVLHDPVGQNIPRLDVIKGPLQLVPGGSVDNRVGGAPAGLYEPMSGFGLLWRGEVAGVPALRDRLGWAAQPEYGYHTAYQCERHPTNTRPDTTCYLRSPDGRLLLTYYMLYYGYFWRTWP